MHLVGILAIALIVLIIVLMTGQKSGYKTANLATDKQENREEFGDVLGALGPYDKVLAAADNQIRQTDPSKRLQPNNAWNAGMYVQSTITSMQKAGIPPEEPVTINSKCKKQCESKDPLASQKCRGMCACHENVKVSCAIDCQYTDEATKDCLHGCMASKLANCNNFSWVFYDH